MQNIQLQFLGEKNDNNAVIFEYTRLRHNGKQYHKLW